jgi:hypothetical protein
MARIGRIVVLIGFLVSIVTVAGSPRPDGHRWEIAQRPTDAALVVSELSR